MFLSLLLAAPAVRAATPQGSLGVGVLVGDPFGPTIKYWVTSQQAFDVGIGFSEDPVFYADYLWHNFQLLPPVEGLKFAPYIGVGPRFQFNNDGEDDTFGIRVPLGISMMLTRAPIEFYAEIVPVFQLSPDTDGTLDGGVGVRVYFAGPQSSQISR